MPGILLKSKFYLINLLLLSVLTGGLIPVFALQLSQGGEGKDISPWEKPLAKCWSLDAEFLLDVPSIPAKGIIYAALEDGALMAIDNASGKQIWLSRLGGVIRKMDLSDSGRLAVLTEQEGEKKDSKALFLQVLRGETGLTVWRKDLELSGDVSIGVDKKSIEVTRRSDGSQIWFDLETGERQGSGGAWLSKVGEGYRRFIIGKDEGKQLNEDLSILTDSMGNISAGSWKARVGAEVSDISLSDHGLVVSSADNFVYMLTVNHGDRKWKRKFTGRLLGAPVLRKNYGLFVTVAGTEAIILDLTNGKVVNNISLSDGAFFTGNTIGTETGFALMTSRGMLFYSPEGCPKK